MQAWNELQPAACLWHFALALGDPTHAVTQTQMRMRGGVLSYRTPEPSQLQCTPPAHLGAFLLRLLLTRRRPR
jgi:hypothetical protein